MISLKDVSVTFTQPNKETVQAVKNVSLEVDKGDVYGIVGYSGAGKKYSGTRNQFIAASNVRECR